MEKSMGFDPDSVSDELRFRVLKDLNKPNYILLFSGRPDRIEVISHDEIVNLTIVLNTSKSIDSFLLQT